MKNKLRKDMSAIRDSLSPEIVEANSRIIMNKVIEVLDELNYKNILTYLSMGNEVQTEVITNSNFNIYTTKTMPERQLVINKYDANKLVQHKYGYYEIDDTNYINPLMIEAAIIPGLAFTQDGNRLGYGGGYYDRFLAKYPHIKRIAVCYDFQLVDYVETDEYDQQMDIIITPSQTIYLKQNSKL